MARFKSLIAIKEESKPFLSKYSRHLPLNLSRGKGERATFHHSSRLDGLDRGIVNIVSIKCGDGQEARGYR